MHSSIFSLLIRKDLRDLFEQLAISYRSMAVNNMTTKKNGVKVKMEQARKPQKLGECVETEPLKVILKTNMFSKGNFIL